MIRGILAFALVGLALAGAAVAESDASKRGDEPARHQRREALPHPDDTNQYLIPHDLIRLIYGAGAYDEELVNELRRIKDQMIDPVKRASLELVIGSQELNVNSPVRVSEVRARYRELANQHPGTWISFSAKLGIAENYHAIDGHAQEKLDAYFELVADLEENALDPSDPFLSYWPMERESRPILEAPRDFVLWRIVETLGLEWNLAEAERMAGKIESEHWQAAATRPLRRLKDLAPEELARRRHHFLNQPADLRTPQRIPAPEGEK